MKVSGSTASSAPPPAASSSSRTALATLASASRITGVAWIAATRTLRSSDTIAILTGADPLARDIPHNALPTRAAYSSTSSSSRARTIVVRAG